MTFSLSEKQRFKLVTLDPKAGQSIVLASIAIFKKDERKKISDQILIDHSVKLTLSQLPRGISETRMLKCSASEGSPGYLLCR